MSDVKEVKKKKKHKKHASGPHCIGEWEKWEASGLVGKWKGRSAFCRRVKKPNPPGSSGGRNCLGQCLPIGGGVKEPGIEHRKTQQPKKRELGKGQNQKIKKVPEKKPKGHQHKFNGELERSRVFGG